MPMRRKVPGSNHAEDLTSGSGDVKLNGERAKGKASAPGGPAGERSIHSVAVYGHACDCRSHLDAVNRVPCHGRDDDSYPAQRDETFKV